MDCNSKTVISNLTASTAYTNIQYRPNVKALSAYDGTDIEHGEE